MSSVKCGVVASCFSVLVFLSGAFALEASDHLDTPTVIADPAADIGDLYAWISSDGRRLNLIMTIVGARFSDRLQYVFHIDSGKEFGKTTSSSSIVCRFDTSGTAQCQAGDADFVRGDASVTAGLSGEKHRFRVFAGLRDDPYFNNVKGTRAALNVAAGALKEGAKVDAAGCPEFDQATSQAIFDRWRHTDDGPPKNFLEGWKTGALVISVDLGLVNSGGKLLAVWGGVYKMPDGSSPADKSHALGPQIERMGRALTANMLIGPLGPAEDSNSRKETYNRSDPREWPQFAVDIQRTLGLYDGYDQTCGNQWLADRKEQASERYEALAKMLADDRLWVDSNSTVCTQYLAVERSSLGNEKKLSSDCGGRTPNYNANAVFRSLLIRGTPTVVDDGLEHDDREHSTTDFPFLEAPLPSWVP